MKRLSWLIFGALIFSCARPSDSLNETHAMETPVQDMHSYARPAEAVVRHLNWQASVNFDKKQLEAVARLDIVTQDKAKELILDTKALHIERVTLGEKEEEITTFTLGDYNKDLGSPLVIQLKPKTDRVNVYYRTSPQAEALQWLSPVQTAGKEQPFLFTQSQAILARSWVPIQDSPGIRFTYRAQVQVPKGMLALMSASNPQKKNEQGLYAFSMDQPVPAYLLALSVGDLDFFPLGVRSGVYAEPETLQKAAYEFADLEKMIEAAETLYGPYSWKRYDLLVLPPSFPFGGMENPRLTFVTPTILAGDRSLTSLVAHELAHSWSGNLVTNASWNDFWLNEGFTVYFERRIMEAMYGKPYADMLTVLGEQDLQESIALLKEEGKENDTSLKLDLEGRNPDEGMTDIAYEKGYFFLLMLEQQLGRDKWDAFLKQYFNDHAFSSNTTEAFLDYLTANVLEPNLLKAEEVMLDAWVYRQGLPENMPKVTSERFQAVAQELERWKAGTAAEELTTEGWSSHEWQHFLRNLPDTLSPQQMESLDQSFGFTKSENAEEQALWLMLVVENEYEPAYPALDAFLSSVGRRKFLAPLYRKLAGSEHGREMAMQIYRRARSNYHYVAVNSIDQILGYEPLMEENRM